MPFVIFFGTQLDVKCEQQLKNVSALDEIAYRDQFSSCLWLPEISMLSTFSNYLHPWKYSVPPKIDFEFNLHLRAIGMLSRNDYYILGLHGMDKETFYKHHQWAYKFFKKVYFRRKSMWKKIE